MGVTFKSAEPRARAAVLRPQLSQATDQLNAKIKEFEEALSALNLGVSAQIDFERSDNPNDATRIDLCFGRWGDGWRLFLAVHEVDGVEETAHHELLANQSRERRLRAVEKLPDLVEAMLSSAESEIARVKNSTASVDKLISALKGAP